MFLSCGSERETSDGRQKEENEDQDEGGLVLEEEEKVVGLMLKGSGIRGGVTMRGGEN